MNNSKNEAEWTPVCNVSDIEPGTGEQFEMGDRLIAVFNDNGTFWAIDDMCPHMGASLSAGFLDGCEVSCPWHAWRFDIRDGTWCDNRRVKIDAFDVRVVDDQIQINLEPKPKSS